MLRELFKTQIVVTDVTQEGIQFATRLALYQEDLQRGAIDEVLADTKEYQFSASDKIFFMPGCTVPRFKVKQLCDATGMSVGKTPDNATVIIRGDNTENEIIRDEYVTTYITKDQMMDYINANYPIGNLGTLSLKQELAKDDIFDMVILEGWNVRNAIKDGAANQSFRWVKKTQSTSENDTRSIWVSEDKKLRDFDKVLDMQKPIVYQNDLLAIINSSNVMTEEMYKEAKKMFDSQDVNNHVLAMELMANCDYQKSAIYLLLLLRENRSEISNRKEKDHVNFRALCTFFDMEPGEHLSLDEIIQKCTEKNLISSEELPTLMSLAKEELTRSLDSDYFVVTDIDITEDLSEAIKKADQIREAKAASQAPAPVTESTESND